MSLNGFDVDVEMDMPTDISVRSGEAWQRAVKAERKVDSVANHSLTQFGQIMRELSTLHQHIYSLTEAIRKLSRISGAPITIPDLQEVVRQEIRRDSDASHLKTYRMVQEWIKEGVGKAVVHVVAAGLILTLGWLAHAYLLSGHH